MAAVHLPGVSTWNVTISVGASRSFSPLSPFSHFFFLFSLRRVHVIWVGGPHISHRSSPVVFIAPWDAATSSEPEHAGFGSLVLMLLSIVGPLVDDVKAKVSPDMSSLPLG